MKKYLLLILSFCICSETFAQLVELQSVEQEQSDQIIHVTDRLIKEELERRKSQPISNFQVPKSIRQKTDVEGDIKNFFVLNLETNIAEQKEFELIRKGNYSQVWLEVAEMDNGHLNEAVADTIFKYLEEQSHPLSFNPELGIVELINTYMGDPPNIDGDGLVDFLVTDVQDGYDPDDGGGYTAGFFRPFDQNTDASATTSNKRDMLYIDSFPGIYKDGDINATRPLAVLSHEYQHLIHWTYNSTSNELTFINEAQSNFASLLSGYFPHGSYSSYLDDTNVGLYRWSDGADVLADYGRAASFASYLWDQLGFENSGLLTQEPLTGTSGIRNALFAANSPYTFEETLINWGIANLINDRDLSSNSAFGYEHVLLNNLKAPVNFTDPDFDSRNIAVQPGAVKYFGFQQVSNLEVTVDHSGAEHGQVRLVTFDGEQFEIAELQNGQLYSTPEDSSYDAAYLVLVYTNPDADADAPLIFTINSTAEQEYEFSTVRTYGGNENNSAGFFSINGNGFVGFSNRYTIGISSLFYAAELYIPNNDVLSGSTDLKVAVYTNTAGEPGTEIASDTISFNDLGVGWQSFNMEHLNINFSQGESVHIVYEVLPPHDNFALPVLVDNGTGIQGVTHLLSDDGEFIPFNLTIGDNYGIWNRIVLAQEVVVSNESISDIPGDFHLEQNYPNPFNPSTNIIFNIPSAGDVQLEVYNAIGRKVATLVNAKLPAGQHEVAWNAGSMASGIYLYKLKTGNFSQTRKMILMK